MYGSIYNHLLNVFFVLKDNMESIIDFGQKK